MGPMFGRNNIVDDTFMREFILDWNQQPGYEV
jgi:hypothetical protein